MGKRLTKEDIKKIQNEIDYRILELRPKLIEAVKEARAQGDLSENFEYYAAKREKNQNESRINYLKKVINFAELIEDTTKFDEVGLNKTVKIYFEDDGEEEEYKLVTTIRGDSLAGRISIESPIGKALVRKKVGDRVYIKISEDKGYYVKILEISEDIADDNIRTY